jgi:hypothetical protein
MQTGSLWRAKTVASQQAGESKGRVRTMVSHPRSRRLQMLGPTQRNTHFREISEKHDKEVRACGAEAWRTYIREAG